jgi:non-specific serine/threonine protein kinase
LRRFRLRAGLSQAALAERAGLATGAVSALEQGVRRSPYPQTLGALAEVLGLSAEERAAFAAAARSAPAPTPAAWTQASSELPSRRTPLIGRERDIQRVRALLVDSHHGLPTSRLVTLTGVGGVGKTSLALAVAAEVRTAFRDGVWLVELASTTDPAAVPRLLSAALGVSDVAEAPPIETVLAFLRPRCALLVLDNCEHLIDACAHLAMRLLDACPEVRLLATCREPLLIAGEQQLRVHPLPAPDEADVRSPERLASNPAVQLFVAHTRATSVDFDLTPDVAPAVAQICVRLEGIPLALELAAARVSVLAPWQILDRLDDAFELLKGRSRAAPTRQQTLRATLDWSHDLLLPLEQAVFRRLSVFAGGCRLEAAEAICATHGVEAHDVLDLVARLVDKSLVIVEPREGRARYRLLEPLRQYATQQLAACDEARALEQQHAAYFLDVAERASPELSGPDQIAWLASLDSEVDNLRAALHNLAQSGSAELELRAVTALRPYWEARGWLGEGRGWLEHAITRGRAEGAPTRLLRDALFGAGRLSQWQADLGRSAALIEESLALSRELREDEAIAEELAWLGTAYRRRGDETKAVAALEEGMRVGRRLGTSPGYASAMTCMGVLLSNRDDLDGARRLLESSLALWHILGDLRWRAITLVMLGDVALGQRALTEARAWLLEGLDLLHAIGDPVFALFAIEGLAEVEIGDGRPARAARWLGATEVLRDRLGAQRALPNWQSWGRMLAALRAQLGEVGLTSALAAGRGLQLEDIVTEAMNAPIPMNPSHPGAAGNGRDRLPARHVAEGSGR